MRGRRFCFLALLFLVLLLLFSPKFFIIPRLAENIAQHLELALQAEKVAVKIYSPWGLEILWGRIPHLEAMLEKAVIHNLTIQDLKIWGREVHFDFQSLLRKGEFRYDQAEDLHAKLHISEEDLNALFWTEIDPSRDFRLTLRPEEVGLEGQVDFWNFPLELKLGGSLEVWQGSSLLFVPRRFEVKDTSIPPFLLEALSEYYSFKIDFAVFAHAITISEIELEEGRVMIRIEVAE